MSTILDKKPFALLSATFTIIPVSWQSALPIAFPPLLIRQNQAAYRPDPEAIELFGKMSA
jgi:hypothetical protein